MKNHKRISKKLVSILLFSVIFSFPLSIYALPVPFTGIEKDINDNEILVPTMDKNKAKFIFGPERSQKITYAFAPLFPDWAIKIIKDKVLVDWQNGDPTYPGQTQVMSPTFLAGVMQRSISSSLHLSTKPESLNHTSRLIQTELYTSLMTKESIRFPTFFSCLLIFLNLSWIV